MTLYELVQSEITARQAAQLYGIRFARNGRAFCPWHDDGKHPALAFYDNDRRCYCFVCHNGGDCISLTSHLLGVSYYEAARQLQKDFNLSDDIEYRSAPRTDAKPIVRQDARKEFNKRWNYLCEICHEADERLSKFTPQSSETDYDKFTTLLGAKSQAYDELSYMWEVDMPK